MISIHKFEDECLSGTRYEIRKDGKLYVGNLTRNGVKEWLRIIGVNRHENHS